MAPNFLFVLLSALVPMLIGFLWYSVLFSKPWMLSANMTEEQVKSGNMLKIFGLSYLLSVLLAFAVYVMVIHQTHIASLFMGEEGFAEGSGAAFDQFTALSEQFKDSFRTFKHGALHGCMGGFTIALPVLGINALFERKGFKYVAINAGYWIVTIGLMGGILCQWG